MNIPKPKKKANGTWIIQVMIDGKRDWGNRRNLIFAQSYDNTDWLADDFANETITLNY